MTVYESLKDRINDAVADEIPVNLSCPHCEREMNFESIIDRSSKVDITQWNGMAERIVEVVIDSLPDIIKEALNK